MFGDQRPIKLPGTTLEQGLERRSHRPLMRYPKSIKLIQRIVVVSDDSVCGSEIEVCHKTPFTFHESRFPPAIAHVAPLGL